MAHPMKDKRLRRERCSKQPFSRAEIARAYTRYLAFHFSAYHGWPAFKIAERLRAEGFHHVTAVGVRKWLATDNLPLLGLSDE
jgi:hypothetical protein